MHTNETSPAPSPLEISSDPARWPTQFGDIPNVRTALLSIPPGLNEGETHTFAELEIPKDTLIIDMSQQMLLDAQQGHTAVRHFARMQDRYSSAAVIHSTALKPDKYKHPNQRPDSDIIEGVTHKPRTVRSFNPKSSQELGDASAAYAEAAMLYGCTHWQPGALRHSATYFVQAHDNLARADDYIGVAYNARRAAELSALMGEWNSYQKWMSLTEIPQKARRHIWEGYEPIRNNWKSYVRREHGMAVEGDVLLRAHQSTFWLILHAVNQYANTLNDVPETVSHICSITGEHATVVTYLEQHDTHLTSEVMQKLGEAGLVMFVPDTMPLAEFIKSNGSHSVNGIGATAVSNAAAA